MPQDIQVSELVALLPEINEISDAKMRNGVIAIWREIAAEMKWSDLAAIPKSTSEDSGGSLIQHVRGVTQLALALGDAAKKLHGKAYDRDLLLAACLLHDASKPVECEPKAKGGSGKSELGRNIPSAIYATMKVLQKDLPVDLANLVVAHTNSGRGKTNSWETALLFYADHADSDVALAGTDSPTFARRFKLNR